MIQVKEPVYRLNVSRYNRQTMILQISVEKKEVVIVK